MGTSAFNIGLHPLWKNCENRLQWYGYVICSDENSLANIGLSFETDTRIA